MNLAEIDFNELNYAYDIIRALENDYGRTIYQIKKFRQIGDFKFHLTCIYTDFCLLEAEIRILPLDPYSVQLHIDGVYY